jgi:hypothetical protein
MLLDSIFGFPRVSMQRAYQWEFVLPSFGLLIDGIAVSKFCQSCRFGQYNIDGSTSLQSGAFKQFYPGVLNIESAFATFVTPIPDIVSMYFAKWKSKIVDNNGFYYPSNNYKKNIFIILYDTSGIPSNFIQLNKCFPVKFPAFNLNYEEQGMVKFEVEFKVDNIKLGLDALSSMGSIGAGIAGAVNKFPGVSSL